jgi:tellurite resistance protein TerC
LTAPAWAWGALVGVLALLLVADLRMGRRGGAMRQAVVAMVAWVGAGLGFGAVITGLAG